MSDQRGRYKSIGDCAAQIIAARGPQGLYQGVGPTLAGTIPFCGTQRLVYDYMQRQYLLRTSAEKPPPAASVGCGLVSSSAEKWVCHPSVWLVCSSAITAPSQKTLRKSAQGPVAERSTASVAVPASVLAKELQM